MNHEFYKQTIAILKGEYKLPPILITIFQWLHESYGVNPVNVAFQTQGTLYSQSISLVFETKAEKENIWAHCDAIAARFFTEIFNSENQQALEAHGSILKLRQKKIPEATFAFESLDHVVLQEAILQLGKGYEALVDRYPQLLWSVRYAEDRFIIFYFTEQQQSESDENGTTLKIIGELIQMLKGFDTLNLITTDFLIKSRGLVIDSKENYDKNFGGTDWMYFR